jgi:hypothetical protein
MSRYRTAIKHALALLIVACVVFFFVKAFRNNWASVRAHNFRVDYLYLSSALATTVLTVLLATYGWYLSLNSFSTRNKVTFRQSIAAVNASSLTKYIPGKIWSYALQLYWLDGLGFSKSVIVYINLINLLVSMLTALILGLVCLVLSPSKVPLAASLSPLMVILLFDLVWMRFSSPLVSAVTSAFNRYFHRNIGSFTISGRLMLHLHAVHLLANAACGCSAYFLCRGIGYRLDLGGVLLVISATLVADVVGFLAFLVPGGLGVREGTMYVMLGGASTGSLALILPVVSRMVSMIADIGLGAVALKLLRSLVKQKGLYDERAS